MQAASLIRTARTFGLEIIAFHQILSQPAWFNLLTPDPLLRRDTDKFLQHLIRICGALDGQILILDSPNARHISPRWNRNDSIQRAAELVHQSADIAHQHGITIAIQPMPRSQTHFLNTAAETIAFCEQVDHPACRLHLDLPSMHDEGKPLTDIIRDSRGWLAHLHLGSSSPHPPQDDAIISALHEIHYPHWISHSSTKEKSTAAQPRQLQSIAQH